MRASPPPKESALMVPVLARFSGGEYYGYPEAKLGRKRIDLLLIPYYAEPWIAVELKIRDWKTALWQAWVNTQVADRSYVALWERFVSPALEQRSLFQSYGVGIISVAPDKAEIVLDARQVHNLTRARQQLLIRTTLGLEVRDYTKFESIPCVSAQRPTVFHKACR
jgi:hypothetical protein